MQATQVEAGKPAKKLRWYVTDLEMPMQRFHVIHYIAAQHARPSMARRSACRLARGWYRPAPIGGMGGRHS